MSSADAPLVPAFPLIQPTMHGPLGSMGRMYDPENVAPSAPPLVLVANDQEWLSRSIESILGPSGFAVVQAHTGRHALELARRTRPDAVIIDADLTDLRGIEVCRILRADPRFAASIPIVVTTAGTASRVERLEAYRAGAWEYCSQPLDAEALLLKLGNFIRSKREIDRCHDDSLLDPATGLYNVRGLARRARELGAEASRRRAPLACVAIGPSVELPLDADGNAEASVQLTHYLSQVVRRVARVSDAVGHLGRSEFAIIAPATEATGAVRLAERIQASVGDAQISVVGDETRVNMQAGYAAVPDFAHSTVDAVELMLRAATALRHVRSTEATKTITSFEDVPLREIH